MAITGRISELKHRANTVYSSVLVVDFKHAHVNTLFSIFLAAEGLNIKISTSTASNRGSRGGTLRDVKLYNFYKQSEL